MRTVDALGRSAAGVAMRVATGAFLAAVQRGQDAAGAEQHHADQHEQQAEQLVRARAGDEGDEQADRDGQGAKELVDDSHDLFFSRWPSSAAASVAERSRAANPGAAPGRPVGEIREALQKALKAGPGTTRLVAQRACTGIEATRRTLGNMVRAGVVVKAPPQRVPGVKRPVPVYALAGLPVPAANDAIALLTCWPVRA